MVPISTSLSISYETEKLTVRKWNKQDKMEDNTKKQVFYVWKISLKNKQRQAVSKLVASPGHTGRITITDELKKYITKSLIML